MRPIGKKRRSGNNRNLRKQATFGLIVVAIAAITVAFAVRFVINTIQERKASESAFDSIIAAAGARNGIDPALVKAVIWRESNFRPLAIGSKGEIGLMQVMPKFALKDWAVANKVKTPSDGALSNPEMNIEVGSWYLARALRYWRKYDCAVELALCEYNAGRTRADAWKPETYDGKMKNIDIDSTRYYVNDIMNKFTEYKEMKK